MKIIRQSSDIIIKLIIIGCCCMRFTEINICLDIFNKVPADECFPVINCIHFTDGEFTKLIIQKRFLIIIKTLCARFYNIMRIGASNPDVASFIKLNTCISAIFTLFIPESISTKTSYHKPFRELFISMNSQAKPKTLMTIFIDNPIKIQIKNTYRQTIIGERKEEF